MNAISKLNKPFEEAAELPAVLTDLLETKPEEALPLWKQMTKEEYQQYQYEKQLAAYEIPKTDKTGTATAAFSNTENMSYETMPQAQQPWVPTPGFTMMKQQQHTGCLLKPKAL